MRLFLPALLLALAPGLAQARMPAGPFGPVENMGGQKFATLMVDRLEVRNEGDQGALLWDTKGWYGGDLTKLRLKAEGVLDLAGPVEDAQFQALYSRAISTYFDVNAGLRQDVGAGPDRTHLVLGVEGLAPYWFDVDTAAFLSDKGELTARIEAEYELLFTQRLILQPRAEVDFAAQDVPERGIGAGLSKFELGLRLRYELAREYAPYIGLAWEHDVANASFTRAEGGDPSALLALVGVRAWF